MTEPAARTLGQEVSSAFRLVAAGAAALLAVIAAATVWLVVVAQPAISTSASTVSTTQSVDRDLLAEQADLRAYLVTGDHDYLESATIARDRLNNDIDQLQGSTSGNTRAEVTTLARAYEQWEATWAAAAIDPVTRGGMLHGRLVDALSLSAFIRQGLPAFTAVQTAQTTLASAAQHAQDRSRADAYLVVAVTATLLLATATTVTVAVRRRRRILRERVVGPVQTLLEKVRAVGRGEFAAAPMIDAPAELLELRDELIDMSGSLRLQQQALANRADEAQRVASRLQHIVDFAREVSASLTLASVLDAVSSGTSRLLGATAARVWLVSDDGLTLQVAHDTRGRDVGMQHAVGASGVGRAARELRLCYSLGLTGDPFEERGGVLALAFPLVKGQDTLVGVLEVALSHDSRQLRADTVEVLEAMGSHAATAIDAALLYARVETQSLSDALTGLPNRRRFDVEVEVEVQRSNRTGRSLSVLMIDVDHFKRVNDTMGHAAGDEVLAEVAELLADHMRVGDTAYRFGGEEFAVLTRDTDLPGALVVAERLRRRVEDNDSVTISVGVASLPEDGLSVTDLLACADAAMYRAKQAGRNRVVGSTSLLPAQRTRSGVVANT